MLEKLIQELKSGGTITPAMLAFRLNTSPELVQMMLEDLARQGLIREFASCKEGCCVSCALEKECKTGSGYKKYIWTAS